MTGPVRAPTLAERDLEAYRADKITLDELARRWANRRMGRVTHRPATLTEVYEDADNRDYFAPGTWGEIRLMRLQGRLSESEYRTVSVAADPPKPTAQLVRLFSTPTPPAVPVAAPAEPGAITAAFNEDQPRDPDGKFASGGNGGDKADGWSIASHGDSSFSKDERDALRGYTKGEFRAINDRLRDGDTHYGMSNDKADSQIALLDAALAKGEVPEGTVLIRGMSGQSGEMMAGVQPGAVITDRGFMSTSISQTAASWSGVGASGASLILTVGAGVHGLDVSAISNYHQYEREVLLQRGLSIQVTQVDPGTGRNGGTVIHATVSPPNEPGAVTAAFNPDQPRDDDGKFASTGAQDEPVPGHHAYQSSFGGMVTAKGIRDAYDSRTDLTDEQARQHLAEQLGLDRKDVDAALAGHPGVQDRQDSGTKPVAADQIIGSPAYTYAVNEWLGGEAYADAIQSGDKGLGPEGGPVADKVSESSRSLLEQAIKTEGTPSPVPLYRGVGLSSTDFKQLTPGSTIDLPASSFAIQDENAMAYAEESAQALEDMGGKSEAVLLMAPAGTQSIDISSQGEKAWGEPEHIVAGRFTVDSIKSPTASDTGFWEVHIKPGG